LEGNEAVSSFSITGNPGISGNTMGSKNKLKTCYSPNGIDIDFSEVDIISVKLEVSNLDILARLYTKLLNYFNSLESTIMLDDEVNILSTLVKMDLREIGSVISQLGQSSSAAGYCIHLTYINFTISHNSGKEEILDNSGVTLVSFIDDTDQTEEGNNVL
jgi:hypothetical protein